MREKKEEKASPSYNYGLSARIKKIFIELHGYSFFHGPSEIRNIDKRFIGRKGIINKLKAILVNNGTKSGAYLVTGYRGMGKSSFVSKVIDEIDPSNRKSIVSTRMIRINIMIAFLSLFQFNAAGGLLHWTLLVVLPFVIIVAAGVYLVHCAKERNELKISIPDESIKKGLSPLRRLGKTFIITNEIDPESKFRVLVQLLYLTFLMHMGTIIFVDISHLPLSIGKFWQRIIFYLLFFFIISIVNIIYFLKCCMKRPGQKEGVRFLPWFFLKKIYERIRNYFNYSMRVYIKINLGYDDLKDIDILRLIARNVEKEYRNFSRAHLKTLLYGFFKFIFIFILVGVVYFYEPVYDLNQTFKEQMKIVEYFPSQAQMSPDEKKMYEEQIDSFMDAEDPVKSTFVFLDHFIYISYERLQGVLPEIRIDVHKDLLGKKSKNRFKILLPEFDYFFWFYFICIYLVTNSLVPRLLGIASRGTILKKLKELNEIIDYQKTDEKGAGAGFKFDLLFNIFRRKIKYHPKADIREIEKKLIDILDDFDRISRFSVKPEFICIFDELDKIEPKGDIIIKQKEEGETTPIEQPETTYFSTEGVRYRQHTIFKILSNLKHFLNTAKAKFIFIAGREMYDAALADVSDRNFFIGSIFHDVIYVNSFLTDDIDNRPSDLTRMTEHYVCQFLFPPFYEVTDYSLKEYKKYLDKFYNVHYGTDGKKNIGIYCENELNKKKIEKIIFTLQNFITYLTYRSNGAPKKITTYFENYIYKPDSHSGNSKNILNSDFYLCVGFSPRNLYLEFGYYEQYTFGMTSYLVNPVVFSVSKAVKDFGDKLLVSTSFLVDHLYKFHKNAFSWRNIELTPEILDFNKAPQLRELISLIINNLSNNHILEIVSGLYSFKFHKKISEEIAFLSKVSEKEAAAFNFTLDESLSLKKQHKCLLKELKSRYIGSSPQYHQEFVNAISFVHMIIGDLHFYDEDYNTAIVEYMEAVQILRNLDFSAANASYFFLLIRNLLQLGFALEKRKSYVSAFTIYGLLVSKIIKFREVDLGTLGLKEKLASIKELKKFLKKTNIKSRFFVEPELEKLEPFEKDIGILVKDWDYKTIDILRANVMNKKEELLTKKNKEIRFDQEIKLFGFDEQIDTPICLSKDFSELLNNTPFSSLKEDLLYCISTFEGIRLIYQPLVAKFQMVEKTQLGGVSLVDLRRLENEYKFITKTIHNREKFLISAEFWCKIADILYYKNGLLPRNLFDGKEEKDTYYCSRKDAICSNNKEVRSLVREGYHIPCRACDYYMRSLKILCTEFLNIEKKKIVRGRLYFEIFKKLYNKSLIKKNSIAFRVMGDTLSDIGNSFLSCCTKKIIPKRSFLKKLLDLIKNPEKKYKDFFIERKFENKQNLKKFNKMEEVFIYYYLAYMFYVRTGEHRESAVQFLKMLYLIRDLLLLEDERNENLVTKNRDNVVIEIVKPLLNNIKEIILEPAIKNLYRAYGSCHRLEIESYKDIFNFKLDEDDIINIKKFSLSSDLKEYIVVFKEIMLKCGENEIITNPDNLIHYCIVNPYYSINKMYNRIIDLKFKNTINFHLFDKLGFTDIFKQFKPKKQKENFHKNILTSIGNTVAIIEKLKQQTETEIGRLEQPMKVINAMWRLKKEKTPRIFTTIEFLIIDSIFCLHEIIKLVRLYGISYMVNHSILANAHRRMGEWCELFQTYFNNSEDSIKEKIKKELGELIGRDNLQFISARYHYEKARDSYYSILELHSEGKTYRNILENMFYLNDDFNDSIYHFNAATERYRINMGNIKKNLDDNEEKLSHSSLYKYEKYIK